MTLLALVLSVVGALILSVGAAMVYLPAGVITAGVALLFAAYIARYMEVQDEAS